MSSNGSSEVVAKLANEPRAIPAFTVDGHEIHFDHESIAVIKGLFATDNRAREAMGVYA